MTFSESATRIPVNDNAASAAGEAAQLQHIDPPGQPDPRALDALPPAPATGGPPITAPGAHSPA